MTPRSKQPDFSGYQNPNRVSVRRDVVAFLVWARDKHPGVFVSYAEITQRINGFQKRPNSNNGEVLAVRRASTGIRTILLAEHGCGLVTDPALGMRATVDDTDLAATQMVKVAGRLRSAQRTFTATSDQIDARKIQDDTLRKWYTSGIVPVAKAIAATDFATRLLPPKKDEEPK